MTIVKNWKDKVFTIDTNGWRIQNGPAYALEERFITFRICDDACWFYGAYDTITISKAVLPEVKCSDTPVDPKATPETKALMKYLASEYGKHILSGQQEIYGGGHGVQTNIRYDAAADKCVDGDGKEYTIDKESYGYSVELANDLELKFNKQGALKELHD